MVTLVGPISWVSLTRPARTHPAKCLMRSQAQVLAGHQPPISSRPSRLALDAGQSLQLVATFRTRARWVSRRGDATDAPSSPLDGLRIQGWSGTSSRRWVVDPREGYARIQPGGATISAPRWVAPVAGLSGPPGPTIAASGREVVPVPVDVEGDLP